MVSESVWRRMLLVATALVIAVAALLALVAPPLWRADTSPYATPDSAIQGSWVFVIVHALVAAALLGTMFVTRRGGSASQVLLGAAGVVELALGFFGLIAAVDIYSGPHFIFIPELTVLLFVCAGGELAAGTLAFAASRLTD